MSRKVQEEQHTEALTSPGEESHAVSQGGMCNEELQAQLTL